MDKIIIAGPCSAESREQLLTTAEGVAAAGVKTLRAGVWKPRTRPGSFEGVGAPALEWLREAKERYGLRLAVELNSARNADLLLEAGIDIVWLGARTTTSPFDVQDIADALRGTAVDVYVKNPVCPDNALWLGAVERILRANLEGQVVAIHRGFCAWERDIFRNNPIWSIPLWLKAEMPDLPVICDPSHICGVASLVPHVARMALELGLDGLMVETHCNPQQALSDATQQLTPDELKNMLADMGLLNQQ